MLKQQRQAWLIVAVLFAALAFIFSGTIATPGIFFAPLSGIRLEPRMGVFAGQLGHARNHSGSLAAGFLLEKLIREARLSPAQR